MKRLPLVLYALVAAASVASAALQPPHAAAIEASSVKLAAVAVDALQPSPR